MVRIPAYVADMLEICWQSNILLFNLPLISRLFSSEIVSPAEQRILSPAPAPAPGQRWRGLSLHGDSVAEAVRRHAVTAAALLPPGRLPPLPPQLSLGQLGVHNLLKGRGLGLIRKVQSNLCVIAFKSVEIRPRSFVSTITKMNK